MSSTYVRLQSHEYYPGNIISGEAMCYFRSPKEFRKIRIRLQGQEHTSWTKQESYYDSSDKKHKSRTVYCSGDRTFLKRDVIVRDEGTLPSGEHVFPISFQLPNDLPSSFQCRYGHIKYTVKITVDRPFKTDLEDEKEINVLATIGLHHIDPIMKRGCELGDEKTICCLCCAGGNMEMQVSLPCRAFAVGYPGLVKVYILNMSNVNVDDLTVKITQVLRFKTTYPHSDYKYDSEQIAVSHNSGVGAHAEKNYNLSLDIPSSAVVPNFIGCELFSSDYKLTVEAGISGCHNNLDVSTEVAVGHEPSITNPPSYHQDQQQQSNAIQNKKSSSWETIGGDEAVINQPMPMPMPPYDSSCQFPVPMPMPMPTDASGPMPMQMPMPMPCAGNLPPYSGAGNLPPYSGASNPSAPPPADVPSAPPKLDLGGNSGIGQPSISEPPPPSYEEVAKQQLKLRQNNDH